MKRRGEDGKFKLTLWPIKCAWCETIFQPSQEGLKFCNHACYIESTRKVARKLEYVKTRDTRSGYIFVRDTARGKAVQEHRVIMENYLGRRLLRSEVVHHKNGVRDDNRLENLELLASQSEHRRRHATDDPCTRCGRILNRAVKHAGRGLCKPCYLVGFRLRRKGLAPDWFRAPEKL